MRITQYYNYNTPLQYHNMCTHHRPEGCVNLRVCVCVVQIQSETIVYTNHIVSVCLAILLSISAL